MMKLSVKALEAINAPAIRAKLMIALNTSENSIYRYIRENDDNLTKAAALAVIRKETGFSDQEILEEANAVQN